MIVTPVALADAHASVRGLRQRDDALDLLGLV
jgi:hypothetical protein